MAQALRALRGLTAAMNEYLAWETDLLPRIERDGSLEFFCYRG